jgi:ABC-type nickel/cobalt efflux system permease component RcnA
MALRAERNSSGRAAWLEPGHSRTMMAAFIIAVRGAMLQDVYGPTLPTCSKSAAVWGTPAIKSVQSPRQPVTRSRRSCGLSNGSTWLSLLPASYSSDWG